MKKYSFIVNPAAGNYKVGRIKEKISSECLSRKIPFKIIETNSPGHATLITEDILRNHAPDYLISVGGDGTLNEVVNGFSIKSETSLGIIPVGSGNDFIKNLNYPIGVNNVMDFILNDSHQVVKSQAGLVEYTDSDSNTVAKKFINAVGIGFDGYVAYLNQRDKIIAGWISYLITVFQALKNLQFLNCSIDLDGRKISKKVLLLTIGRGKCSGGGFYLTPFANPFKEKLDLTVIDYSKIGKIIRNLPKAVFNKLGTVREASFYEFEKISIKLENPYFAHADGEILSSKVKKLDITLDKNPIKIISGNKNVYEKTAT